MDRKKIRGVSPGHETKVKRSSNQAEAPAKIGTYPARGKDFLDWETISKLCEQNGDFAKFVEDVKIDFEIKTDFTASLRSIKMKSARHGNSIFPVEVTNISCNGIWILIDTREMFLAFEYFPWFQEASIKKILHVEMPSENHLYWPELNIDLDVNSILYPENYPLVSQHQIEH